MTETTTGQPSETTWSVSAPHVRNVLKWIKKRGMVNAEDLVEWDRTHGRKLFNWDDPAAAEEYRKHEARLFLNRFRGMFDGMRVRALIHVSADDISIPESGYFTVEAIAADVSMRAQVVDDIMRRMRMLASELRMWKLSPAEQADLFTRLAEAMSGKPKDEAA